MQQKERFCDPATMRHSRSITVEKKHHSIKNHVIGNDKKKVIYLSQTYEGKVHDKKICDEEELIFPKGIILYQDSGYQGFKPDDVEVKMPTKKPKGEELTQEQKNVNRRLSQIRVLIEHINCGIKRCRIVKDTFRSWVHEWRDVVMLLACGLHNFRVNCRYGP